MPRVGFSGNRVINTSSGSAPGTLVVPADMVAGDVLEEVAGLRYLYDTTAVVPVYETTARSQAAASTGQRYGAALPMLGNGLTFDPQLNNTTATLLASATRTATTNTGVVTNYNARGVTLCLNVTANPGGAETLTLDVFAIDPILAALGTQANIASLTIPAATSWDFQVTVYPGIGAASDASKNKCQSMVLPRLWLVRVLPSGSGNWTYSLTASYHV